MNRNNSNSNSNSNKYCPDCNYEGSTIYHYNRHIVSKTHINIVQYKTMYLKIKSNSDIVNLNMENINNINKINNNQIKYYNDWFDAHLKNPNVKQLDPMIKMNNGIFTNSLKLTKTKISNTVCPWCLEYNYINNLIKKESDENDENNENASNEITKMTLNNCLEHMKVCAHKKDHKAITKNLSVVLANSLKTISDMTENFKILTTNYNLIAKENKELIDYKARFYDFQAKFDTLKTKYNDLKKEKNNKLFSMEEKYEELLKIANFKSTNENVHYTINAGNNANINLMSYFDNHCKEAVPIDAVGNNIKIIEHKYRMDYMEPKIEVVENNETIINEVLDNQDKIPDIMPILPQEIDTTTNFVLHKMFVKGYLNDKNSYHIFIADFLIKYHKKQEPNKQPIWNTDSSR